MSMQNNHQYRMNSLGSHPSGQQGAALIVVLMVLILIMLVSAVAVRRSQTDLKLANSAQIDTLLLQGADGANAKIEQMVNGPTTSAAYRNSIEDVNGIFGHFISGNASINDEVIYCYNPRASQEKINSATVRRGTGYYQGLQAGECNPNQANSYVSGRQTVLTQVGLRQVPNTATAPFENTADNTNQAYVGSAEGAAAKNSTRLDMRATSAIPAYADPGNCFENRSFDVDDPTNIVTVSECLRSEEVPSKQLNEQVDIQYRENPSVCQRLGTTTTPGSFVGICGNLTASTTSP